MNSNPTGFHLRAFHAMEASKKYRLGLKSIKLLRVPFSSTRILSVGRHDQIFQSFLREVVICV